MEGHKALCPSICTRRDKLENRDVVVLLLFLRFTGLTRTP